jgi:hypothetical protein
MAANNKKAIWLVRDKPYKKESLMHVQSILNEHLASIESGEYEPVLTAGCTSDARTISYKYVIQVVILDPVNIIHPLRGPREYNVFFAPSTLKEAAKLKSGDYFDFKGKFDSDDNVYVMKILSIKSPLEFCCVENENGFIE